MLIPIISVKKYKKVKLNNNILYTIKNHKGNINTKQKYNQIRFTNIRRLVSN